MQSNYFNQLGVSEKDAFLTNNFAPTELRRNIEIVGLLHKRVLGSAIEAPIAFYHGVPSVFTPNAASAIANSCTVTDWRQSSKVRCSFDLFLQWLMYIIICRSL